MFYLFLFSIVVFHEATSLKQNSDNEDLINFIDLLNSDDNAERYTVRKTKYREDEETNSSFEKQGAKEFMRLLQRNYDAKINYDDAGRQERLHLISNPEVIDEYRSYLKKQSLELEDEADLKENSLKQLLQSLRRNAVFRLKTDKRENVPILRLGRNIAAFESSERERIPKRESYDFRDVITKKYDWNRSLEKKKSKPYKDYTGPKIKPRPKIIREETSYRRPKERKNPMAFGRTSIPFAGKRGVYEDAYK